MTPAGDETLVLYSRLAFYPIHWLALERIVEHYAVRAVVLAAPAPELPSVHAAHGTAEPAAGAIEVRRMPAGSRRERVTWLARQLRDVRPDAVWVQEEPIDPFLLEILALSRFSRRPRIVAAVCENIFPAPANPIVRAARRLLWPRLDGLMAVASPSIDGIRAAGMPADVRAHSLVAGGLEPPAKVEPLALPFAGEDFVVGFAGRIVEEKGWRVLVAALRSLPHEFKLAVAGDGPDLGALLDALPGRVHSAGLLPKRDLWSFYAATRLPGHPVADHTAMEGAAGRDASGRPGHGCPGRGVRERRPAGRDGRRRHPRARGRPVRARGCVTASSRGPGASVRARGAGSRPLPARVRHPLVCGQDRESAPVGRERR